MNAVEEIKKTEQTTAAVSSTVQNTNESEHSALVEAVVTAVKKTWPMRKKFEGNCYYCGKQGHMQNSCFAKKAAEGQGPFGRRGPGERPARGRGGPRREFGRGRGRGGRLRPVNEVDLGEDEYYDRDEHWMRSEQEYYY